MQVWSAAVAVAVTATCPSGTHRESVFPPHDRQHSDGKTALRHVQELRRTRVTRRRCETVYIANTFAMWQH